jgi:hypothetical protein
MYDQLVRLTDEVQDMSAPMRQAGVQLGDHESRIRRMERWLYALPITALTAIAAIVVALRGK